MLAVVRLLKHVADMYLYIAGAVFNLISHDGDNMIMEKIENHFGIKIAEVMMMSIFFFFLILIGWV